MITLTARQAQYRVVRNLQLCAGFLASGQALPEAHRAFLAGLGCDPTVAGIADRLDKERHTLDTMSHTVGGAR